MIKQSGWRDHSNPERQLPHSQVDQQSCSEKTTKIRTTWVSSELLGDKIFNVAGFIHKQHSSNTCYLPSTLLMLGKKCWSTRSWSLLWRILLPSRMVRIWRVMFFRCKGKCDRRSWVEDMTYTDYKVIGLPSWSGRLESALQCREHHRFDPWAGKSPHAAEQLSHVPQLLSPCAATTEARTPRACAPQQEKPSQWESCALQQRLASALCN